MNNYEKQALQAKKLFLTYDQQELIQRCRLRYDRAYFYIRFLGETCRIDRKTGDMERLVKDSWIDGNGFNQVMTVLDWLCDSRADRYITGKWVNALSLGHHFHTNLQEKDDPDAKLFDRDPAGFQRGCEALGGEKVPGGDIAYAVELVDGLKICVQLWRADAEFEPKLCFLWDENTLRYLRYETTWYAAGLLLQRIKENMK